MLQIDHEDRIAPLSQGGGTRAFETAEHAAQCVSVLGGFAHAVIGQRHHGHQQAHDGEHHEQLDQREAALRSHASEAKKSGLLGVADVGVLAFATSHTVGSERDDLDHTTVERILIRLTPRIGRHATLQIRTIPTRCIARLVDQRIEALFGTGKTAHVQLEQLQRFVQIGDLHTCSLGLGAAELAQHTRPHQTRKQGQNGQHDQQFDQGKALGGTGFAASKRIHDGQILEKSAILGAYPARSLIDKIPSRMDTMIEAIIRPSTMISSGSTRVKPRLIPISTSRFRIFANSSIMGPIRPVSSPTMMRLMAKGSKICVEMMASTTLPPTLTLGATSAKPRRKPGSETCSVSISKAVSNGTPFPSKVPRERENK